MILAVRRVDCRWLDALVSLKWFREAILTLGKNSCDAHDFHIAAALVGLPTHAFGPSIFSLQSIERRGKLRGSLKLQLLRMDGSRLLFPTRLPEITDLRRRR